MIAVIFEVVPTEIGKVEYMNVANQMSEALKDRKGLISIERFQGLTDEGKVLSLSFWEDVESVTQWQNHVAHNLVVVTGVESNLFESYRIRLAEVFQDHTKEVS
ncbi:antibiotic biosynthesis monooxygenase family protein [Shewanella gelidii]|uniref:Antibiotic biosynthesis monooxygenase n=1 Tax=Shewanella gelidii TaxID=1642821 RepID=A0A917NEF3_9GAMM|nr:antibiotic biosynthesis monooxygenase [Shewanella gelidii]MCL1099605.1 antibiotic biosynthesis monooxygenase [Shewanella gelidii]GGI92698.1 antibiotic biosynthesis monooxygenase [Shewanella gelidii]